MYGSHSGGGYSSCPSGIPVEFALLSILAAFAVAFGILYRALTLITGRRKKRDADSLDNGGLESTEKFGLGFRFADLLWFGKMTI